MSHFLGHFPKKANLVKSSPLSHGLLVFVCSGESFPTLFRIRFPERSAVIKKHLKVQKLTSQRCPKGRRDFRGGASCGTFGAPVCFFTRKVHPKCSKSDPKVAKLIPKVVPSAPKVTPRLQIGPQNGGRSGKRDSKSAQQKKGPADCAKRLQ